MNQYRCENCNKIVLEIVSRIQKQPELENSWNGMANAEKNYFVGDIFNIVNSHHSDFQNQRDNCAEILDALIGNIIEHRWDFQVPDKHGRCPEVPGFKWLLDYIGNRVAEIGRHTLIKSEGGASYDPQAEGGQRYMIIPSCNYCNHRSTEFVSDYCKFSIPKFGERKISDVTTIPDWCPLSYYNNPQAERDLRDEFVGEARALFDNGNYNGQEIRKMLLKLRQKVGE